MSFPFLTEMQAFFTASTGSHEGPHHIETLVGLMVVATLVGLIARRFHFPYTVSLVVVGIALHALGFLPAFHLNQELLMTVFLPALLFEAAIHVPGDSIRRIAPAIASLAIPGVLVAAGVTALFLRAEIFAFADEGSIPFLELLLFGTMISATDPISVVALFKQLGVEKKLAVLIEGESLFNDGTAVVVFGIVLEILRTGEFSLGGALIQFLLVAAGGMVVGAAVGLLASWATSLFDDHLIEIALTAIAAYGAFLLAERIHVSGVLATVLAGLFVGNIGKKKGMSPHTRVSVLSFWEYMAFFINSIVFLLLGLEVTLSKLWDNVGFILMAFVAVLIGRGLVVFGAMPLHRRQIPFFDKKVATVLWWGGLRGSLSIVLVLALPHTIAARDTLIAMTFGVVVLSVILQGASMKWVLTRLGLVPTRSPAMKDLSRILARLRAVDAQRDAVAELVHEGARNLPGLDRLERELELKKAGLVAELNARKDDPEFVEAATAHAASVHQHMREVARDAIREALDDNLVDDNMAADLIAEINESQLAPEKEKNEP